MDLEGRVALITGGASGIGLATAQRLASEGMRVCVVDLDGDGAATVAGAVEGLAIGADVSDRSALDDAFGRCLDAFGRLDVAYLDAGVSFLPGDIAEIDVDICRRLIAVNVDHVVFGTSAAVRAMRGSPGDGQSHAAVATASLAGIDPFFPSALYTLTKHAVVGFIRALAPDLAAEGIAAHAICPGLTATGQIPPTGRRRSCERTSRSTNPSAWPRQSWPRSRRHWTRPGRAGSSAPANRPGRGRSRRCQGRTP